MDINQSQLNTNSVGLKSTEISPLKDGLKNEPAQVKNEAVDLKDRSAEVSVEKEHSVDKNKSEDLNAAIAKISEHVQNIQRDLIFSVDKESGRDVVTIKDAKNDEVIKQYPSEEILVIARNLNEQLAEGEIDKAVSLFSTTA